MIRKIFLNSNTEDKMILERIKEEVTLSGDCIDTILISMPREKDFDKSLLQTLDDNEISIIYHSGITNKELNEIRITIMEKNRYSIAIDGPSGSGKSTIAKTLAGVLNIDYLDTGAMYRAITYKLLTDNIALEDEKAVCRYIKGIEISIKNNRLFANGEDINDHLRDQIVTKNVSLVSGYPCVRTKLVDLQRDLSKKQSSILDGRDIGTVVLPDAEYKFYLNADVEIRAKRRFDEITEDISYEEILADIIKRDEYDKNREHSPLKKAEDAVEIDSSSLSISEVVEKMLKVMRSDNEYE